MKRCDCGFVLLALAGGVARLIPGQMDLHMVWRVLALAAVGAHILLGPVLSVILCFCNSQACGVHQCVLWLCIVCRVGWIVCVCVCVCVRVRVRVRVCVF